MPKASTDKSRKQPQPVPTKLAYDQNKTSNGKKSTHLTLTGNHEMETTNTDVEPGPANEPLRRGRGRPKKITVDSDRLGSTKSGQQPPAPVSQMQKREKENLSSDEEVPQPPPKRTKTKQVKPQERRDKLPDRTNRNVHPATNILGPARRTSKDVAAEREEKRNALEAKILEAEKAKQILAEMNASEDIQDNQMEEDNPQRISAAVRKRTHAELENDSANESFNFQHVDAMVYSDDESAEEKLPPKKRGKAAKGSLRKDIQDRVEKLQANGDGGGENKRIKSSALKFTNLETVPKKYQNAGLRKVTKPTITAAIDPFENGGLNDEDIISARPTFSRNQDVVMRDHNQSIPATETLKHDISWKNELVGSKIKTKSQSGNHQETPAVDSKETKPAKSTVHKSKSKPKLDAPDGSAEFFEDARWKDVFIPTITHALYVSREPFVDWTADSKTFLATVQKAFDLSFPNVKYTLSASNAVTKVAYDRIKSRRSLLASTILGHISGFFKEPEFAGKSSKIGEYVAWALRPGGPAYYDVPTPQDGTVDRKDPNYVRPEGFLESHFIVPIAKKYIQFVNNSAFQPPLDAKNPPHGLYAMIMIAVERAFSAHRKGFYIAPLKFNQKQCGGPLKDFLQNLDKVKEERWKVLLQYHIKDVDDSESDSPELNCSAISAYRANLYISSSPIKP